MDSDESPSTTRRGPLDQDDHDLLTFDEVRERLSIEIHNATNLLEKARMTGDRDAIESFSARLNSLTAAASRNRASGINDANFEKFFGYPGIARRRADHPSTER